MDSKVRKYMRLFPSVTDLQIYPSNRKGKRFTAEFTKGGKRQRVHFGQDTAHTYYDGASLEKRRGYRARASKITDKYGRYTYMRPGSANSFAYHILW